MTVEQSMALDAQQHEALLDHLTHCNDESCCGQPPDSLEA